MSMRNITHKYFLLILSVLSTIEFIVLAIKPYDRTDWVLKNIVWSKNLDIKHQQPIGEDEFILMLKEQ